MPCEAIVSGIGFLRAGREIRLIGSAVTEDRGGH